eukprot:2776778-Pyramimonas_sp.AAC.1
MGALLLCGCVALGRAQYCFDASRCLHSGLRPLHLHDTQPNPTSRASKRGDRESDTVAHVDIIK